MHSVYRKVNCQYCNEKIERINTGHKFYTCYECKKKIRKGLINQIRSKINKFNKL